MSKADFPSRFCLLRSMDRDLVTVIGEVLLLGDDSCGFGGAGVTCFFGSSFLGSTQVGSGSPLSLASTHWGNHSCDGDSMASSQ